ncbi:MAG TPA: methylated-DNA--[protein]-cysteine S-methyltransferase [Clostridia bacterium]|nr:methylated-DNA--[protein]-cysteine S-methyltransferase [Clostridia bacterium]
MADYRYSYVKTPLGKIYVISEDDQIISADFEPIDISAGYLKRYTDITQPKFDENQAIRNAREWFEAYFAGETIKKPKIKLYGTDFNIRVWNALAEIPFGQAVSYGYIAAKTGNPKSAIAVGQACKRNPILIIIPCHRVIGSDGKLKGFAGKPERKEYLLQFEKEINMRKADINY